VARAGPLDWDVHSWPGSGRKVLEVRGPGPCGRTCLRSEAATSQGSGPGDGGMARGRPAGGGETYVAGRDLTNGARRVHQLKYSSNGGEVA
jgi:hypothetical protein